MTRHRRRVGCLAVAAMLVLAGCRDSTPREGSPSEGLAEVLIDEAPSGFALEGRASGGLDRRRAAVAVAYANPGRTEEVLEDAGFAAAHARIWTRGADFVSAYVFRLDNPVGAQILVDHAMSALKGQATANTFPFPDVSGGQGYVLTGAAREGKRTLFCQGVWFARGGLAFNQNSCSSDRPVDSEYVIRLAREQLRVADEGELK